MVIKMVLNFNCEINDFKLVCLLTVFDGLFQRTAVRSELDGSHTFLIPSLFSISLN